MCIEFSSILQVDEEISIIWPESRGLGHCLPQKLNKKRLSNKLKETKRHVMHNEPFGFLLSVSD